jgi:CDP-diacylglycerol--glycerol-3-phosphate 3-phosphatidyltransferase
MSRPLAAWPDLGRFWTIPNALSLLRLVLVIPITVLIWRDGPVGWLFGLVVVAILTDWFDGRVARWTHTVSDWGKVIDPISDKFAAIMTVSALTLRSAEPTLPFWFLGLVVGRDVLIVGGSALIARRSGRIAMSAWAGKAATTWLALTVVAAVLKADAPVMDVCMWMSAGLLVFSFLVYVIRYLNMVRRPPPPARREDASAEASPERGPEPEDTGEHTAAARTASLRV